jgi:polyisoprenyl-phosphate glycosyltransferase
VNDSLSIIIPVHDPGAGLAAQIEHLLELLPELTGRFEILVVDDGSTDHTVELVRELACEYPQLRLIRHVQPRGLEAAVKTGLQWSQGSTVLVQEFPAAVSTTDLQRLWSLRHDQPILPARALARPGLFDPGLLERLTTWGQTLRNLARGYSEGTVHMIRREAAATLPVEGIDSDETRPLNDHSRADEPHAISVTRRRAQTFLKHLRDLVTGE